MERLINLLREYKNDLGNNANKKFKVILSKNINILHSVGEWVYYAIEILHNSIRNENNILELDINKVY